MPELPSPYTVPEIPSLRKVPDNKVPKTFFWIMAGLFLFVGIILLTLFALNYERLFVPHKSTTTPLFSPHPGSDTTIILNDLNVYLATKKSPPLSLTAIDSISNQLVLEKLESSQSNFLLVDIRERRETQSLLRLKDYPNLKYIRFGDLINKQFEIPNKDTEIVVASFKEGRETVAASYLYSLGYTNVKILNGGLDVWAVDNLPTAINRYAGVNSYNDSIDSILKYISNPPVQSTILEFGSHLNNSSFMIFWDSKTLADYINSLAPDKSYILKCTSNKSCYEATYFWFEAKDKIKILGYSGYTGYLQ